MLDEIVSRIRDHALSQGELRHGPSSLQQIEEAESLLGFSIPPLLRACYEQIGNGGFGPGYGVIGLAGGADSDYGSIVETYEQLKSDQESEGQHWRSGLLPFCDWGCNIFTCVDCESADFSVSKFEDFVVREQGYNLEKFFEMWINGIDILSCDREVTREITNPFTGTKSSVTKRQ